MGLILLMMAIISGSQFADEKFVGLFSAPGDCCSIPRQARRPRPWRPAGAGGPEPLAGLRVGGSDSDSDASRPGGTQPGRGMLNLKLLMRPYQ
jgi:hypothetical protein